MKKIISFILALLIAFTATGFNFGVEAKALSSAVNDSGTMQLLSGSATPGRQKLNFNQGWKFIRKYLPDAVKADYDLTLLERWESVNLPHSVRLEPYNTSGGVNYQGQAMYRKHFYIPEEYTGKKIFVEFEAAMGVTDVWVNGTHTQTKMAQKTGSNTQYGGYLPFILDITDLVKASPEVNVITVLTDNSDNTTVPPGKPQGQLDFTYMGGIYRNVWMEVTDPVHITNPNFEDIIAGGGILVDYPSVSEAAATVNVKTHVRNENAANKNVQLITKIMDKDNQVVGSATTNQAISAAEDYSFGQTITVNNPKLWNIDTPYMHTLVSTVVADGVELDKVETPIGIRKVEISAESGILINGKDAGFLSGINRHQEYPYIGFAASSSLQRRDAIKFKSAGFNFVRTAHHPQSVDFLNACDELGIMVMESVPGWQHWSTNPNFAARVKNDIRQMVRRDRNHPSILTFEISLNESPGVPNGFTNELEALAKTEHPSVKTSAENPHVGAKADILYGTPSEVASWSDTACAVIREYADLWEEQNGNFGTECRVTRGPGTFYPGGEARMVNQANKALWLGYRPFGTGSLSLAQGLKHYQDSNKRFVGINKWIGIDHNRGYADNMSPCGIWDLRRMPKYMYYAYESQRPVERDEYLESQGVKTGPMLFVASTWGEQAPVLDKSGGQKLGTDESRMIYVYSNAERVKLSVIGADGTTVLWTNTQSPATRNNGTYLDHAPFEFNAVPYTAGSSLKAEGLDAAGTVIAAQNVYTAGVPAKLMLETDYEGLNLIADGSDAVMVYAYVLDENGNVCSTATNELTFSVNGPGSIIGDGDLRVGANPVNAEAGVMGVYIKSDKTPGNIDVTVRANGLESATTTIVSKQMTQSVMPYQEIAQGPLLENSSMFLTEKIDNQGNAVVGKYPRDYTKGTISSQGTDYPNSIEIRPMTRLQCNLEGKYSKLTGKVALKDPSKVEEGTIFKVYLDGVLRFATAPVTDQTLDINVDISGAKQMVLEAEDAKGINTSNVLWLSPYIYEGKYVPNESELRENVALNKNAVATSSLDGNNASNAVDGDAGTMWSSREAVALGAPQALTVDLSSPMNIRNARVALKKDYFNYTYTISVSKNNSSWVPVSTSTKTGHASEQIDKFVAENIQYIKIEFTEIASTQGEDVGPLRADIVEFEAYRDKGVETVSEYNLKGFYVGGKNIVFHPSKTEYTMNLSGFENEFYVKALPEDYDAVVTVNGVQLSKTTADNLEQVEYITTLLNDEKKIVIEVTSASGKGTKTYTITALGEANKQNVFYATDCFVPDVNGANNWYYESQAANGTITTIPSDKGLYVSGEYAWEVADWFYSGPRFMHPASSSKAVRTFKAPKAGNILLKVKAEKYPDQPGSVSINVLKNGTKIWPEGANEKIFDRNSKIEFELPASVNEGDRIQIVVGSAADGVGGDATCMTSAVFYTDSLNVAEVTIQGDASIVATDDKELLSQYKAIAETESGIVITNFECDWNLETQTPGISISSSGLLLVSPAVTEAEVVVQAIAKDTHAVLATKNVTISRIKGEVTYLSDLNWKSATCGDNRQVQKDKSTDGKSIQLTDKDGNAVTYAKGLGIHAASEIVYDVKDAGYDYLSAMIGIDFEKGTLTTGADADVIFKVYFNDESSPVYESGRMAYNTPEKAMLVKLRPDVAKVRLVVDEIEHIWSDHADWADAKFIKTQQIPTSPSKDTLLALITTAKEKAKDSKYTQASRDALTKAIETAQAVADNDKATEQEIADAENALQNAINALEEVQPEKPSKEELLALIQSAKEKAKDSKYTQESRDALTKAIETAQAVAYNDKATEQQIADAQKALQAAINALEEVQPEKPSKEELLALIQSAKEKAKDSKYTQESRDALTKAIETAQAVAYNDKATEQQIADAQKALQAAINALEEVQPEKPSKEALLELIASAKEMVKDSKYTDESRNALTQAIATAQAVAYNDKATEQQIADAQKALQAAINALEEVQPEKPSKEALLELIASAKEMVKDSKYTDESRNALTQAIATAQAVADNDNATEQEIVGAQKALQAAVKALVKQGGSDKPSGGSTEPEHKKHVEPNMVPSSDLGEKLASSSKGTDISVRNDYKVATGFLNDLMKSKDKSVTLNGDWYSWIFDGKNVENNMPGVIWFDTRIGTDSPNADAIGKLTGDADTTNLYFSYEGNLPGETVIRVQLEKYAGKPVYVYYHNPEKGRLELIQTDVKADEDGWIEFSITHCSDYVVSASAIKGAVKVSKPAPAQEAVIADEQQKEQTATVNPETGGKDNTLAAVETAEKAEQPAVEEQAKVAVAENVEATSPKAEKTIAQADNLEETNNNTPVAKKEFSYSIIIGGCILLIAAAFLLIKRMSTDK